MADKERKTTKRKSRRILWWTVSVLAACLAVFCAVRFYYPFGRGVKTGQLNFVVYKGVVFKTYEGRLIQTGFKTDDRGGIQSNEFNFSITDREIAEKLMMAGGQTVELRYKEYFGALPWRGYSRYIVDEIISLSPPPSNTYDTYPLAVP